MRSGLVFAVVSLACSREMPPARTAKAADSAPSPRGAVSDSMAVRITGPTLIAFYPPVRQAQVDSSDDLSEALGDFSFHLSAAQDSLRALGFTIVERPYDSLRVVEGATSREIKLSRDSAQLGYVFIAPGRRDEISYGVMTNMDLINTARRIVGRAAGAGSRPPT